MTAPLQPDKELQASHRVRAHLVRKTSNSTPLERTMRKVVRVLAEAGSPSLIVGGYAVQEHGYTRFTSDLNIVVPDVSAASGVLSINGFRDNPDSTMSITDRVSKIEVDLLPGGGSVGPGPCLCQARITFGRSCFSDTPNFARDQTLKLSRQPRIPSPRPGGCE